PRSWYGGTTCVPVHGSLRSSMSPSRAWPTAGRPHTRRRSPAVRTSVELGAREAGPTRRSVAFVALEPDEPVGTGPNHDLAIGSTPRPRLQVVHHSAAFGEKREPAAQSRGSGSTEQGQHHAFGSEWQFVPGHIGARQRNGSVGQVAVGDGIGRAVGPVELRES